MMSCLRNVRLFWKKEHLLGLSQTFAVRRIPRTSSTSWICRLKDEEKTMMLSRQHKQDRHFTPEKMISMLRWNVALTFRKPNGILTNSYDPLWVVNAGKRRFLHVVLCHLDLLEALADVNA